MRKSQASRETMRVVDEKLVNKMLALLKSVNAKREHTWAKIAATLLFPW